jgi:hypothetical protein
MPETESAGSDARRFQAEISLPSAARVEFNRLWREWEATNPEWTDDEHALCEWIATHYPEYFSSHVPRVGYIEVRLEALSGGMLVSSIDVLGGGSASGLTSGGGGRARLGEAWHFDLAEHRP